MNYLDILSSDLISIILCNFKPKELLILYQLTQFKKFISKSKLIYQKCMDIKIDDYKDTFTWILKCISYYDILKLTKQIVDDLINSNYTKKNEYKN